MCLTFGDEVTNVTILNKAFLFLNINVKKRENDITSFQLQILNVGLCIIYNIVTILSSFGVKRLLYN